MDLFQHLTQTNQLSERYVVNLTLNFFVKGLPKYKLDAFVSTTKKEYTDLEKNIQDEIKKSSSDIIRKKQFQKFYTTLTTLSDQVKQLSAQSTGKKDGDKALMEVYNKAYEIRKTIDKIKKSYEEIVSKKKENEV